MDTVQTDSIIRKYVATGSGIDSMYVIPYTSHPAPQQSIYAVVHCININYRGAPWTDYESKKKSGVWKVLHNVDMRYSIQWIGQNSMNYATAFREWLDSPLGLQYAVDRHFACNKTTAITSLDFAMPDNLSGNIVDKSRMDITISITLQKTQQIPVVE